MHTTYLHKCVSEENNNPDGVNGHDHAHAARALLRRGYNMAGTAHGRPHARDRPRLLKNVNINELIRADSSKTVAITKL